MIKKKADPVKTILTITVGFTVLYLITGINWLIFAGLGFGVTGIFSSFLTKKIDFLWMRLSLLLGLLIPNILLSIVFYLVLFPLSVLSKVFGKKDALNLKNNDDSLFLECNKKFNKASFEKPW